MNIPLAVRAVGRAAQNFVASFKGKEAETQPQPVGEQPGKEWTVLVYMDGRNGLAASTASALRSMKSVGSSTDVNLVTQATLEPTMRERLLPDMGPVPTRRYLMQAGKAVALAELPQVDKLTEQSLADFVSWGMETFPAKNYLLVVKRHGEGFLGHGDEVPLSAEEIREALEQAEQRTGRKPSVISFDSCAMSQAEVAYELRDRAEVMVASAENVLADNYPYQKALTWLKDHAPKLTPEHVGHLIVEGYKQVDSSSMQTAVDLPKQQAVGDAVKQLVQTILEEKIPAELIYTSMMRVQSIEPGDSLRDVFDFRDLWAFLKNLAKEPRLNNPRVRDAALQAQEQLQDSRLRHHASSEHEPLGNANGLTAYVPWQPPEAERSQEYGRLEWARDTGWDRLLDYVFEPSSSNQTSKPQRLPTQRLSLGQRLAKSALFGYKKYVSPYLARSCCFQPSCSQYARQAVEQHGLTEGMKYFALRYISCHGGYSRGSDPVPGIQVKPASTPRQTYVITAPPAESQGLGRKFAGLVSRAAGLAGKVVGAMTGACIGLPLGLVGGALIGAKVGNGSIDQFNKEIFTRYKPKAPEKVVDLQAKIGTPAFRVRNWVLQKTDRPGLATVVGGVLGGVSGAVLAGLGGAHAFAREGALFTGLLGSNLSKDMLGQLPTHPANEAILQQDYHQTGTAG